MKRNELIGIVGGVGPHAGVDLAAKVFSQTDARRDQEHLPVALLSMPGQIADRTSFLLGETDINPAIAISTIIRKLEKLGAGVIGIPCNSSHAPQIFNVVYEELKKARCKVKLVHMIDEVAEFLYENYPGIKDVGVLASTGLYTTGIYKDILERKGLNAIFPSLDIQNDIVHKSIYDPAYGIKAQSNPVTERAKRNIYKSIRHLQEKGAKAVILGCTELCIAIADKWVGECAIIDSNIVLARALIRQAAPSRLKTWERDSLPDESYDMDRKL